MATKTKTPPRPITPRPQGPSAGGPWLTPPWTTAERLQRIQTMVQRINGYAQFMSEVSSLNGTSGEAKDRAVIAFYESLAELETQLGRIQEELQLG